MEKLGLEVHKEVKKLMNLLARYARNHKFSNEKGNVTRSQALMLEFIFENSKGGDKVYQKDIEKHFSIRRSTATESMKRLEALGMIIRKTSTLDARLKEIILTKKATDFITKTHDGLLDLSLVMCNGITKEEAETLKTIVIKMQNNLKENSNINA